MKTAQLRRSWVPRCLAFFGLLLLPHTARAYQVTPDLEIRFVYRGEDYVRLTNTERRLFDPKTGGFFFEQNDHLMAQRNELRIDAEYTLHSERLFPWLGQLRFFGQLRPWWDSDWRISNTGQGKRDDELTPFWEHPFTRSGAPEAPGSLSNSVDPLFREYYVDIAPNNFFFRIGRQIIPWGKSDGVYMLDVINPFNLRNPTIFEEENIKIPIWAANLNWRPFPDSNLQLIYDPHYFNHVWPGLRTQNHLPIEGRFHDWTYQIVGFFNDFYNGEFGFKVPVFTKLPANTWSNSIIGFRWSDTKWRVNYTLNYLYTYTPSLIDFPNTGTFLTGTMVLRQPARIHVAGGSADYDVKSPNPWLDGTVFRVETAFTLGDQYYKGLVGNPVDTDHWGVMAGVDRYVLGDYLDRPVFASMQYWHDLVISTPASCGGCGPRAGSFQDLGFNGGFQGLRGPYKSLMTLYLYKTWLAGDTLIGEFFALYEHQFQDWWIRPKMTYKYDDYTTVALGWNVFAGGKQTPYGEWKDNTNAFVEIRRTIF